MKPIFSTSQVSLYQGDAREVLKNLPDSCIDCCVTSPPYFGLRDYGCADQIGQEDSLQDYVDNLVEVFAQVHRTLKDSGTFWLNLGDSYSTHRGGMGNDPDVLSGLASSQTQSIARSARSQWKKARNSELPEKNLLLVPARVAIALQDFGWILRSEIIWEKPNCLPQSVKDRTTHNHEKIFLFTKKSKGYFYDSEAIKEPAQDWGTRDRSSWKAKNIPGQTPHNGGKNCNFAESGRNCRSVWKISTVPFRGAHFAIFPPEIPRRCIVAGCPENGVVLDPFAGSGTTLQVAKDNNRRAIGIELNSKYCDLIFERCRQTTIWGELRIQRHIH